jgi:dienelactone hydrolase
MFSNCARLVYATAVVLAAGVIPGGQQASYATDLSTPGPFSVGQQEIVLTRSDLSTYTSQIFYPATDPGLGSALDLSGGPYPVVTFGHGFVQLVLQYQPLLEHLTSHGYIVVATDSQFTFTPDHEQYSQDLRQGLDYLEQATVDPSSPFFQGVDVERFGASGHSMGAGASLLAAAADPRIRAVANLAAAETNPSAIAVMPQINVPISLITGSEDQVVPPSQHGELMYDAAQAPRQLPLILGGSHCGFQDLPFPFFCDAGSLSRDEQLAITRQQLTSFFDFYLKEDESIWTQVWGPDAHADPRVVTALDPGVLLTPDASQQLADAGDTAAFDLLLTNTGPVANSFELFVERNAWATGLSAWQSPVLAPGESWSFTATVQIPTGGSSSVDQVLLSARSDADGLTRGYTVLTTMVPEPATWMLLLLGAATLFIGTRSPRAPQR